MFSSGLSFFVHVQVLALVVTGPVHGSIHWVYTLVPAAL